MKTSLTARRPAAGVALAVFGLASTMVSFTAQADAQSAAANLVNNMARSGRTFNVKLADMVSQPTLVRGIYAIYSRQGKLLTYTNESGLFLISNERFSLLQPTGGLRALTPEELTAVRAEVMANIEYDKLIKVTYGNGGGRKQLMLSAIDCPACQQLEEGLEKNASKLNTRVRQFEASFLHFP